MATYTYNNIDLNLKKFDLELKVAGIDLLINYYQIQNSNITFFTFETLTTQDENTLTSIVNNHEPFELDFVKESLSETSTNSTDFIEKVRLEELAENKEYYINWYYEYGSSKTNRPTEVIVNVNGNSISHIVGESKDKDDRRPCSGRIKKTLIEGINVITIEYKTTKKNTNAIIRNANLFIEEI